MKGSFAARHPRVLAGLTLGFGVFLNCFGFPVYNLTRDWPSTITLSYLFLTVYSAGMIGWLLTLAFPRRRWPGILLLVLGSACVGLGCRYLLEWGEVSNSYNFTLPNILLHLTAVSVLSLLGWYSARRTAA